MTRGLANRVTRLERALLGPAGLRELDLTPISDEELERALSVPWLGNQVGRVRPLPPFMPRSPEAARAVEQAAKVYEHAMNVGYVMIGFRDDIGSYLDAALPRMFPEPRGAAVEAMIDAIRARRLPLIVRHIVYARNGAPAPDSWKSTV